MTARRPSYNEDSDWCQEHGHTGILAGCGLCDALLARDPAFAEGSGLRERHNLDGTRGPRQTAAPTRPSVDRGRRTA